MKIDELDELDNNNLTDNYNKLIIRIGKYVNDLNLDSIEYHSTMEQICEAICEEFKIELPLKVEV